MSRIITFGVLLFGLFFTPNKSNTWSMLWDHCNLDLCIYNLKIEIHQYSHLYKLHDEKGGLKEE